MHVTNMNSPRTGKPVANQFIITNGDITVFQSYASTIATIDYYDCDHRLLRGHHHAGR